MGSAEMVAEPIRPAMQALPRLTDDSWRMAGCGERCRIYWVSAAGRTYPEQMVSHDPHHHEAYGESVLARQFRTLHGTIVRTGELELDGPAYAVRVNGQPIAPTPREAGILFYLAAKPGEMCVQEEILRAVWGPTYAPETVPVGKQVVRRHYGTYEAHLLRVNVSRLRGRLGSAARLVETVIGRGYRLKVEPAADLGVRP